MGRPLLAGRPFVGPSLPLAGKQLQAHTREGRGLSALPGDKQTRSLKTSIPSIGGTFCSRDTFYSEFGDLLPVKLAERVLKVPHPECGAFFVCWVERITVDSVV